MKNGEFSKRFSAYAVSLCGCFLESMALMKSSGYEPTNADYIGLSCRLSAAKYFWRESGLFCSSVILACPSRMSIGGIGKQAPRKPVSCPP